MDEDFTDLGWGPKETPDCGRCCDRGWTLRGPSGRRRCPECNPGRVRAAWNWVVAGYRAARYGRRDESPPF